MVTSTTRDKPNYHNYVKKIKKQPQQIHTIILQLVLTPSVSRLWLEFQRQFLELIFLVNLILINFCNKVNKCFYLLLVLQINFPQLYGIFKINVEISETKLTLQSHSSNVQHLAFNDGELTAHGSAAPSTRSRWLRQPPCMPQAY